MAPAWPPLRMAPAASVVLLALCFGLGWANLFLQISATTVAAKEWSSTALSLLPYGLLAASHALWAVPAQILMRHFPPKPFYLLGAVSGMLGNGIMVLGAYWASYPLLLAGSPFAGIANAYVNFLRFEAARFVPSPEALPLAISAVIAGGVMGGALGPLISRFTRSVVPGHEFLATYATSVGLWALEATLLLLIPFGPREPAADGPSAVTGQPGSTALEREGCSPGEGDPGTRPELGLDQGAQAAQGPRLQAQTTTTGTGKDEPGQGKESAWAIHHVLPSHQGADGQAQAGASCKAEAGQAHSHLHLASAVGLPAAGGECPGTRNGDSPSIGGRPKQVAVGPQAEAVRDEVAGPASWSADVGPQVPEGVAVPDRPPGVPVRRWYQFLRDPAFVASVSAATFSYTFMATFMLASVLAMTFAQPGSGEVDFSGPPNQAITYADTSNVIIAHVEAMFIPSFFTGFVIRGIGADGSMLLGFSLQVLSQFLLLVSAHLWTFFVAMVLLGLGWNLAFVGATACLSTTYRPGEKDLVQGMNDAVTFGVNTLVTTTASIVLQAIGQWPTFVVLYASLTVPGLAIAAWFWLSRRLVARGHPLQPGPPKHKLMGQGSVTSRFRLITR